VDAAGPVLEAKDLAGLGDMSEPRVVAAVLPVVRIEPAKGPGHGGPGADDSAVDILQLHQGVEHQILVELDQWG
jgi:hypothetical protein